VAEVVDAFCAATTEGRPRISRAAKTIKALEEAIKAFDETIKAFKKTIRALETQRIDSLSHGQFRFRDFGFRNPQAMVVDSTGWEQHRMRNGMPAAGALSTWHRALGQAKNL
jgi:hypothetical protein